MTQIEAAPSPVRLWILTAVLALSAAAPVRGADRDYASPAELLTHAVLQGRAQGTLSGPVAVLFARRFAGTGPLQVDAEVIGEASGEPGKDAPRPGCKRVRWRARMAGSAVPAGATTAQPFEAQMVLKLNWCAPGRFWFEEPSR